MIILKNVSKRYGHVEAIRSVSLTINAGDIHGIVGASGAGKSTILRMMNFLEVPDEGEVHINGQVLNHLKGKQLRRLRQSVGMIFQGFHLIHNKTVFENVSAPLEIAKVAKKERIKRVMESLEFVGLEDFKQQYPAQLSGGQKQRVAIARALVNQPKVLLCDEPTSALDPKRTMEILEVLKRINQVFKVTIVLVSHEIEVIKRICQRVTVIENGEIYDEFPIEPMGIPNIEHSGQVFIEQLKSGGGSGAS